MGLLQIFTLLGALGMFLINISQDLHKCMSKVS